MLLNFSRDVRNSREPSFRILASTSYKWLPEIEKKRRSSAEMEDRGGGGGDVKKAWSSRGGGKVRRGVFFGVKSSVCGSRIPGQGFLATGVEGVEMGFRIESAWGGGCLAVWSYLEPRPGLKA